MEFWDIYDKDKKPTGRTMKKNDWILKDGEYHLSVLGVIHRPDGRFLITQRVMTKAWAPGWWEVSGGAAQAGESSFTAVSKKSLIDSAKDYVHRNYRSVDLGLDDTCKELGVSNSYFSSLFKKETGSSFVEYLTDYRMDKAARMLVETDDKSYVIAQNVGYADPNYFSYVFKRKYGVSPSRYRTEYEKNKV